MTIRTNIGCAGFGENYFRGFKVHDLLREGRGFWSMMSLAVGGKRLSDDEETFVDALAVTINAADPRIWPLKVAWLVACHGNAWAGVAALMSWLDHGLLGPVAVKNAAGFWLEIEPIAAQGGDAVIAWCEERRRAGKRIGGLGVPAREEDERVPLVMETAERFGRDHGRHYELFASVKQTLREHGGPLRVNIAGAFSACMLDLGYSVEQVGWMVQPGVTLQIVGNAIEARRLTPESLQRLDPAMLRYAGPPPRPSPRKG